MIELNILFPEKRLSSALSVTNTGQRPRQWWLNFGDVEVDVDVIYDVERVQATSASLYTHTQGLCCTTFGKWLRAIFSAAPSFILVASDRHCTMLGFICGAFLAKIFLQQNSISEKYHQSFPQIMFFKECKCFRIYNYVLYFYFTHKCNHAVYMTKLWYLVVQNTALFSTFRPPSITDVTYQPFSIIWWLRPWKPRVFLGAYHLGW